MTDATKLLLRTRDALQRIGLSVILVGDCPADYALSIATWDRETEVLLTIHESPAEGKLISGMSWKRGPEAGRKSAWQHPADELGMQLGISLGDTLVPDKAALRRALGEEL